jgi:hypothetical protein
MKDLVYERKVDINEDLIKRTVGAATRISGWDSLHRVRSYVARRAKMCMEADAERGGGRFELCYSRKIRSM